MTKTNAQLAVVFVNRQRRFLVKNENIFILCHNLAIIIVIIVYLSFPLFIEERVGADDLRMSVCSEPSVSLAAHLTNHRYLHTASS